MSFPTIDRAQLVSVQGGKKAAKAPAVPKSPRPQAAPQGPEAGAEPGAAPEAAGAAAGMCPDLCQTLQRIAQSLDMLVGQRGAGGASPQAAQQA